MLKILNLNKVIILKENQSIMMMRKIYSLKKNNKILLIKWDNL